MTKVRIVVYKAVVVDKDYGSVSYEELQRVKEAYAAAGIELELAHYVTEDEIIEGCRGAVAFLGTGNPDKPHTVISNHNGGFDVDEDALVTGAALYAGYALARLG